MSAQNNNSIVPPVSPREKNFKSFAATLSIAFLILVAIIIIIDSGFNIYFSFNRERNLISSEQKRIAQEAANTVSEFIDDKIRVIAQAAYINDLVVTPDRRELVMSKLLGLVPSFRQLILVDRQGEELQRASRLSSSTKLDLTTIDVKNLLSAINQNKNYISSVYFDQLTQEPIVAIAVPARNIFGDVQGGLIAEVNLKFMWDLVGNMKIGESGLAYVVDESGNLIAFRDISRVLARENLKNNVQVKQFMNDKKEKTSYFDVLKGIQNTWVVSSFSSLDSPNWAVVVEIPATEAYETLFSEIGLLILITLLLSFACVTAVIYLSKRMTKQPAN